MQSSANNVNLRGQHEYKMKPNLFIQISTMTRHEKNVFVYKLALPSISLITVV
jgi:hypothetical protein